MVTRTTPGYAERRWEPIVDARTGPGWCRSLAQVGCKREVGSPGGLQRWSHGRCRVMPSTAGSRPRTHAQGLTRKQDRLAHRDPSHSRDANTPRSERDTHREVHSAGSSGKSVSGVDTADRLRSLQLDWLAALKTIIASPTGAEPIQS